MKDSISEVVKKLFGENYNKIDIKNIGESTLRNDKRKAKDITNLKNTVIKNVITDNIDLLNKESIFNNYEEICNYGFDIKNLLRNYKELFLKDGNRLNTIDIKNNSNIFGKIDCLNKEYLNSLEEKLGRDITDSELKFLILNSGKEIGRNHINLLKEESHIIFEKEKIRSPKIEDYDKFDILFDGLIYEIDNEYHSYNEIFIHNDKVDLVCEGIGDFTNQINDVATHISFFISDSFYDMDFNPSYQRELVWELSDKQKLIRTIVSGGDIGNVWIYNKVWEEFEGKGYGMEVLDGKQRLTTIKEFVDGKFPLIDDNGIEKYFYEFSVEDKIRFSKSQIKMKRVEGGYGGGLSFNEKARLFLLINDTGKKMKESDLDRVRNMIKD